jgi:hypothetical protein
MENKIPKKAQKNIEDKVIFERKLKSVTFTPVIEYKDDDDRPQRFIYFISEYHQECFNRQGTYLIDRNYKKIFGYKCQGVPCEDLRGEEHGGLLVQSGESYFSFGNRAEKSRFVGPLTEDSFYFDEPMEPDYVLVGEKSQLIDSLKEKAEKTRQAEIEDFRKQDIEAILLSPAQISDNFRDLIAENTPLRLEEIRDGGSE